MNIFDKAENIAEQAQADTMPVTNALSGFGGITPSAQSGNIILTGTVQDGADIATAVAAVTAVAGVTNVTSNIEVADVSAQGIRLKVNTASSNLNIRSQPSTSGEIVAKAAHDEEVILVKKTNADWYYIKTTEGEEGYSATQYLVAV